MNIKKKHFTYKSSLGTLSSLGIFDGILDAEKTDQSLKAAVVKILLLAELLSI